MKKYGRLMIEILVVFIAIIYCMITIVIPEYRESQGSSDSFIRSSRFQNMIEVRIDDKTDFAFVLDKTGIVYHLFFFDNTSVFLYNQNIEGSRIDVAISRVIPILIENELLQNTSSIEVLRDNDEYYPEFQKKWMEVLSKYSLSNSSLEKVVGIEERGKELNMESEDLSNLLLEMDFYSKEIVKNSSIEPFVKMTKENSYKFTNEVYKKIETYIFEKNIVDQKKDEADLSISLISGDTSKKYYPTTNSWYYVENRKVYAYIEFMDDGMVYSYCYQGSIDSRMEGECKS